MKGKILVVDDERPIRELLGVVLGRDYQVAEAESGAALQRPSEKASPTRWCWT